MDKAVFLDRDGVINVEKDYVYRISNFVFIDGVHSGLLRMQELGFRLVVVTNQAGIGRGYYTDDDFHILTEWMKREFESHGVHLDAVYYCPYHPHFGVGPYKRDSEDRKPGPGMILRAQRELKLDLSRSIIIGDRLSDMEAGSRAGVHAKVLVETNGSGDVFRNVDSVFASAFGTAPVISKV